MSSMEDISAIISQDQGLTARVLRWVNSAYYGLQAQVSSISRAVSILGLSQIRDAVLSIGVKSVTRDLDLSLIDLRLYWRHQISTAILARELARKTECSEPDDLFTIGILHDLGKIMTAIYDKQAWLEINALASEEGLLFQAAEQKYWGIDHALVGGMLLQQWNLPEWITEPVNWHHNPEMSSPQHLVPSRLVYTANNLVHRMDNEQAQDIDGQLEKISLDRDLAEGMAWEVSRDPGINQMQKLFV